MLNTLQIRDPDQERELTPDRWPAQARGSTEQPDLTHDRAPTEQRNLTQDLGSTRFGAGCTLSDETLAAEALADELAELAAHLWSGTARFLRLLGELDASDGWGGWGAKSCASWLSWRCGLSPMASREHVRVARALRHLPRVAAAFERGILSYSKVRAISRIASPATEVLLLEWAQHATAAEMEELVRSVRLAKSATDPNIRHKRRFLRSSYDAEGCLVIHARLEPEEGAVVLRALEVATETIEREEASETVPAGTSEASTVRTNDPADEDPYDFDASPPRERRGADALCALSESYLAHGSAAISGDDRTLIIIHVDPDALSAEEAYRASDGTGDRRRSKAVNKRSIPPLNGGNADDVRDASTPPLNSAGSTADARCELESGPPVAKATAQRLACDASLLRVLDRPDAPPITIGRRSRVIPRGMRRAIRARDRGCRFPGCDARRHVDAHHIRHWAHGGDTSTSNLLLLCRRHHRLVHEQGFRVHPRGGRAFAFSRPDGRLIEVPVHVVDPDDLDQLNPKTGFEFGPQTYSPGGDFTSPDYGLAVEVFLATEEGQTRS